MSVCVVVGSSPEVYWDGRVVPDMVLCADGGLHTAFRLGLKPDVWIGDADSSVPVPGVKAVALPKEKDYTDTEACLRYGLNHGMGDFILIGCTGGRLDHFLGNVNLLEFLAERGARGVIINDDNEISFYVSPVEFPSPHHYRYVSILPLDRELSGVSIHGVKYPLREAVLERASSYSVSNEPLPLETVRISIERGSAVIVRSERVE